MKTTLFGGFAVLAVSASTVFASLIPIGEVPSTGNGIGAVDTILTFQAGPADGGVEYGCVGYAGGSEGTGSTQCFGGIVPPGGVTHEQTGSGNNIYLASDLGISAIGTNTFANAILIFNGNEGGNAGDQPITLSALSLNLFDSAGGFLEAFTTVNPYSALAFPGVGNAGFGFQLDSTQAAQANALLAANPGLWIGASAFATGANAGPETVSISRIDTVQGDPPGDDPIPEPSTVVLMGLGLLGASLFRRKQPGRE